MICEILELSLAVMSRAKPSPPNRPKPFEPRRRGVPQASSAAALNRMRRATRRDTNPEIALRSQLHKLHLRYRVDVSALPGMRRRADVVFSRARVAVFVDGCFWHGCPEHGTWPKANADRWRQNRSKSAPRS